MLTIANRLKSIVVHIKDKTRTIAVFGGWQGIIKVSISLKRAVYRFWENDCAYKGFILVDKQTELWYNIIVT